MEEEPAPRVEVEYQGVLMHRVNRALLVGMEPELCQVLVPVSEIRLLENQNDKQPNIYFTY